MGEDVLGELPRWRAAFRVRHGRNGRCVGEGRPSHYSVVGGGDVFWRGQMVEGRLGGENISGRILDENC